MKRFISVILALLICCGVILAPIHVHAANSTITISPFLQEVRFASDSGTTSFTMQVTNNTEKAQTFKLSAVDFGSLDESGGVVFAGTDANNLIKKYGLAKWLALDKQTFNLAPGQSAEVHITVIDDVNLSPGGHYAAIVASVDGGLTTSENQISVNQKLSSLILATKTGGEKYDMKLTKVDFSKSIFSLPKSVVLHFYNPGNVHVVPRGTVRIVSSGGKLIAQGVINEESGFILPETSRQMLVNLRTIGTKSLLPADYSLQVDYRYDGLEEYATKSQRLTYIHPMSLLALLPILSIGVWLLKRRSKPGRRRR